MRRLVIASAAKFESDDVIARLADHGILATQIIVGIGLIDSAQIAARLRNLVYGRDVVFCCTGGILGRFAGVRLFQARSVRLRPVDLRLGQSYIVEGTEPSIELTSLSFSLPPCNVSGSATISLVAENGDGQSADIETLELYSVAKAWGPCARTLTGVVASTNAVGPNAHMEWKNNFREAASKTANAVVENLLKHQERWK